MKRRKVVLITGVSQGIGKQLVLIFLNNGYLVLGQSRKPLIELTYLLDIVLSERNNYIHLNCEIKNVNHCLSENGQLPRIDFLINNAAHLIKKSADLTTAHDFTQSFNVNCVQPFLLIQSLKAGDLLSIGAHVVQISSVGGIQGSKKYSGLLTYSASKAALISLTESLQVEWGDSLTFNTLALGAVKTSMFKNAFSEGKSEISDVQMAQWIYEFTVNSGHLIAGQTIQVKKNDPV